MSNTIQEKKNPSTSLNILWRHYFYYSPFITRAQRSQITLTGSIFLILSIFKALYPSTPTSCFLLFFLGLRPNRVMTDCAYLNNMLASFLPSFLLPIFIATSPVTTLILTKASLFSGSCTFLNVYLLFSVLPDYYRKRRYCTVMWQVYSILGLYL